MDVHVFILFAKMLVCLYGVFIKQLSVCDVPQLFESLASVVPIKLGRVAHCDVPRCASRCATHYGTPYVHGQLWVKNDWQFYNPRIDTAV